MGIKILMGFIVVLPMALIFFGVMYYEGRVMGRLLFGVTMLPEMEDSERVKEVQSWYKKRLWLTNGLVAALFIIGCIPERESVVMSIFLLLILVITVAYFIPFAGANRRLKSYKAELILKNGFSELEGQNTVSVDMSAAVVKKPVSFIKTGALGMALGIVPALILFIMGGNKDMEGIDVFILLLMGLAGAVMFAALFISARMRTEIVSKNSAVNIQFARARSYQINRIFVIIIWLNAAFNFYLMFQLNRKYTSEAEVIIASSAYSLLLVGIVLAAWYKLYKLENKYRKDYMPEGDEDKYWLWGMFYYNKNDSRFMVNKRMGMGTTINMAKPAGKIFMAAVMLILFVSIVGSSLWMLLLDFTPVRLEISDSRIVVSNISEEYSILLSDIKEAELLAELPDISKRTGTGMDTLKKGSFRERDGTDCRVCVRINGGYYIRLVTDYGVYYVNDEDGEETLRIYNILDELKKGNEQEND